MQTKLDEQKARIGRLALEPEAVRDTVGWLAGPFLRALSWRPRPETVRVTALLTMLRGGADHEREKMQRCLALAIEELDDNVGLIERACVVRGRAPMVYISWLWRVHGVIVTCRDALLDPDPSGPRVAGGAPRVAVAPPLVIRSAAEEPTLSVGTVDVLLEAARDERDVLRRRRRFLEAARRVLLDAAAALPLDAAGVSVRQANIAAEIAAIDRFEAAGVVPEQALSYQLRRALGRHDRQKIHALAGALDAVALRVGDLTLGRLTGRALEALGTSPGAKRDRLASVRRSADEMLSGPVVDAVGRGLRAARREVEARLAGELDPASEHEMREALPHLGGAALDETLAAALSVDGCFEVGGVMSPVRVEEEIHRVRMVPWPTEEMSFAVARTVGDVRDALIEHPRTLLLDLASGRLLTRRFIAETVERKSRTRLASEVRVYVLDGSTSMMGPRGRMRDAIMVAELATMMARLNHKERYINPVLYYRYFTKKRWPLARVATRAAALDAIGDVLSTVRTGGTDIEAALLDSFERIRLERDADPDLARAQIVLVTDGEAPVDAQLVQQARAELGALSIGVSVIALGEENPALRAIAASQRRGGDEVFYQFIDDERLRAIVDGESNESLFVHGASPGEGGVESIPEVLSELVDEIEALDRARDAEALACLSTHRSALDEVDLSLELAMSEAERAHAEADHRDRQALFRRFERWFPEPDERASSDAPAPLRDSEAAEERALATGLLLAVAEVVDLVGSAPIRRQADAVEVLERLLSDAGVAPWGWARILQAHRVALAAPLRAVRAAALVRLRS